MKKKSQDQEKLTFARGHLKPNSMKPTALNTLIPQGLYLSE